MVGKAHKGNRCFPERCILRARDHPYEPVKRKLFLGCGLPIAALLLALAGLLAYGSAQPEDHVAASRAAFARPPAEVFERLVDFEGWPRWNRSVTSVARDPEIDGKPCWRLTGSYGELPIVIEQAEAPERVVTRIPADAGLGFSGTWTYELAPAPNGGTTVAIREDGHVDSVLVRALGALFMDPHDTMDDLLRDLGASFGESTTPEEVP